MLKKVGGIGLCAKLCGWLLAPATVKEHEGEGLSGSEYGDSQDDDLDGLGGSGEDSEDEIEEIPEIPDPYAKKKKKWLQFRYIPIPKFIWDYLIYCDRNTRIIVEEKM